MSLREWMLAGLLALAAVGFVVGVALVSVAAAWMAGAVLGAGWVWLVLSGDDDNNDDGDS